MWVSVSGCILSLVVVSGSFDVGLSEGSTTPAHSLVYANDPQPRDVAVILTREAILRRNDELKRLLFIQGISSGRETYEDSPSKSATSHYGTQSKLVNRHGIDVGTPPRVHNYRRNTRPHNRR